VVRLAFRGVADRSAALPSPRGHGRDSSPRLFPGGFCAFARRSGFASLALPPGAVHGGRSPIDSAAVGLAAPLLDLRRGARALKPLRSAGVLEVPTIGVRHMRKHARESLLTLTPTFPSRPDSMRSDLPAGLPLLGLSKDRPSIVPIGESDARARVSTCPSGRDSQSFPRSVRVVLHHLDGFPLRPCRLVSSCCRSWGSPCFHPSRNGFPHSADTALRSLPPADSYESGTSPSSWARVTSGHCWPLFTANLAPPPFSPGSRAGGFPPRARRDCSPRCLEPGPRGLAPSSGPLPPPPFPAAETRYSLGLG
jgi:hypothetical protein